MKIERHIAAVLLASCLSGAAAGQEQPPSFVVLFADDLGYGDLGCYGHPTIRTPELDRMAAEGVRFTQFYSAAPVCTPSRGALLTGRLPVRNGLCGERRRVLFPNSPGGLQDSEITVAELLKSRGYATACIGKWHLGHLPQYLPTRHGFDYYFGVAYSNDMKPIPLLRGEEVIEEPAVQETLTQRYTEEALAFIRQNRERPFFLYLPHTFPHVPLFASDRFRGRSPRGLYGDVVEELDWSTGEVLRVLRELGLDRHTLVLFTSDNGPWLTRREIGGSAGLLRDGKGSTWEGGLRVPGIAWWPGRIPAGRVETSLAATLDVLPTLAAVAGVELPADRTLDGFDLSPVLFQGGSEPRQVMFYYRGCTLYAIRKGPWKAHLSTRPAYGPEAHIPEHHDPPLLYQLEFDPSEQYDVSAGHPEVVADLLAEAQRHRATVERAESQVDLPEIAP